MNLHQSYRDWISSISRNPSGRDWENLVMPVTSESDPVAWALEKAAARAERVALLDSVGQDDDEAMGDEDDRTNRTNGWLTISVD